jgi:hypothetical protein
LTVDLTWRDKTLFFYEKRDQPIVLPSFLLIATIADLGTELPPSGK